MHQTGWKQLELHVLSAVAYLPRACMHPQQKRQLHDHTSSSTQLDIQSSSKPFRVLSHVTLLEGCWLVSR